MGAATPGEAAHAARLRGMAEHWAQFADTHRADDGKGAFRRGAAHQDSAACLAGAAALDEVASLRTERDKWHKEACDLMHRLDIFVSDFEFANAEISTLRARVAQLEAERGQWVRLVSLMNTVWTRDRDGRAAKRLADAEIEQLLAALTTEAP